MHTKDDAINRLLGQIPDDHNRAVAGRWATRKLANGRDPKTVLNAGRAAVDLLITLGDKRVEDVSKEDVESFLAEGALPPSRSGVRRAKKLQASVFAERKKSMKAFLRDLLPRDQYVDAAGWVEAKRSKRPKVQPADLVTKAEAERLVKAARTTRDKAIMALLCETGMRPSEVRSLRVGDVEPTDVGSLCITLPDDEQASLKTGRRWVDVFDAAGIVLAWLDEHPARRPGRNGDDDLPNDAPLFCVTGHADRPMRASSMYDVVRRTAQNAAIPKRVNPKLLRHSAAAQDKRRGMPHDMMNLKYGWARGSVHAAYYGQLSGADLRNWELRERGLAQGEQEEGTLVASPSCPRCAHANAPGARFCLKCGRPLTPEAEASVTPARRADLRELVAREVAGMLRAEVAAEVKRALGRA